jgi:hypothetical protein
LAFVPIAVATLDVVFNAVFQFGTL